MTVNDGGLHVHVLDRVGPDLLWGDLRAAGQLRLESIEERYGVSRSVAREVVRVLESMGLVASRPRIGITVRPRAEWHFLDPRLIRWRLGGPERADQLRSITDLRRGMEPIAAELAATHATPEQCGALTGAVIGMSVTGREGNLAAYLAHDITFHQTLLQASGNELFASLGEVVAAVLTGRTQHHLMPEHPEPAAIRLHADVAEAISSRDPARAGRLMREIVSEAGQAMEAVLQDSRDHSA